MNNLQPTVIRVQPANTINATGQIVRQYQVTFMVGTHGPFQELFAAQQFKPEIIRARLAEVANTVNGITEGPGGAGGFSPSLG